MGELITWEQAVSWLREQEDQEYLVRACYYDDPLPAAAERFHASEEWAALREWLPKPPGQALDLGAGRGISSYALAKDGWAATALEPDSSDLVGAGAIRKLIEAGDFSFEVVEDWGEALPFPEKKFDVVYGRAVFHHANDLGDFCREAFRVLKPGGRLILTREHVLSKEEDLQDFLDSHPLHHLYGGEAAYTLDQYLGALRSAGFEEPVLTGPLSSPVNYFPETRADVEDRLKMKIADRRSKTYGRLLSSFFPISAAAVEAEAKNIEEQMDDPGRLYSFICDRPS